MLRNSGCRLAECLYKTGPHMRAQGEVMACRPDIFAPVLAITDDGYVMPRLRNVLYVEELQNALVRLPILWGSEQAIHMAMRSPYREYVRSRVVPVKMLVLEETIWWRCDHCLGTAVGQVHGDPTVENIVVDNVANLNLALWLDPDVNPHCPRPYEAELDAGKLMQSAHGYEQYPASEAFCAAIRRFITDSKLQWPLVRWYCASHLIRLYPHQPHKQQWALRTMEALAADATA